MKKVIVIGGGAAGMMAAVAAAKQGNNVILLEKNEKLGKKIYITGKGRGNFTNSRDISDFFDNITHNSKFMYSALYSFSNVQVIDFFEKNGMHSKEERGGRMFPVSDHASDITKALSKALKDMNVDIRLNCCVKSVNVKMDDKKIDEEDIQRKVEKNNNNKHNNNNNNNNNKYNNIKRVTGVTTKDGFIQADSVIIATGGLSYPSTGSTGDGLRFAEAMGIKVTHTYPSLVSLETSDKDIFKLQGLSLKNVNLTIKNGKKVLYESFGDMLFTHKGISGPIVLSASSLLAELFGKKDLEGYIDLKPKVDEATLNKRLIQLIQENNKKEYLFLVSQLLPRKMHDVFIGRSGIEKRKRLSDLSKQERIWTIELLKEFPVTIKSAGGFNEAIITRGGVDVSEIDPATMHSKRIDGLSFAGEVIDVDALTGGYNMQIAFSTGYLSGTNI